MNVISFLYLSLYQYIDIAFLSLVIAFILKSALCDMSLTAPDFFLLSLA